MKMDATCLRTEHLSRSVGEKRLVEDITLEVCRGEVLAVVGPSGAGKTSFLRLLNRLDEPTRGTVFLGDRDYRTIDPRDLRRRVGMVAQQPFLFPGTVAGNIRFGPEQRGGKTSGEDVERWLSRVGLAGYQGRDVATLSGGEAQRVSLARTLANSPEVLLLDEPTSALDEASKGEVEALILEILRSEGLTCLIVTHDMAQAARMANRVMLMQDGRMARIGTIQEMTYVRRDPQ